jgi:hypothetical protein
MNPPEDPLDDLLALWQMEDSTPREFQRRVWHRIAADQDHLPWHAHLLAWFLQPKQFLSSFATAIALGVIAGLLASAWHEKQAHDAYLAAINPLNGQHQHQFTSR